MKRSRLKNIINKSKELSNKTIGESSFDKFKKSLPIEVDDNYRLESAWKAYGSPKNYQEALWYGMIQPIDETNIKLPSIGYNEETDEYEYLNKGKENETVNKDIRVWDNDVIPLVKELKQGGFIRIYDEEKDCWKYSKNKPQDVESFKLGGKKKIKIYLEGDSKEGEYIEVDSLDDDLRAGRKPIGKDSKGRNRYLNGDNKAVLNLGGRLNGDIPGFLKGGKSEYKKVKSDRAYYDKDSDTVYYTNDEDLVHEGFHARPDSVLLEQLKPYYENLNDEKILNFGGNLLFVKRFEGDPGHFYSPEELGARISAAKFRTKGNNYTPEFFKYLRTNENLYGDNMRDLLYMYNDENLSKIFNIGNTQAFKQGGLMNVIPEGALHARKNNMEGAGEDFTSKGIPVVDNNGNQTAEIEKEEWTMSKELTNDVESWYKLYYDDDTSLKEKDELAIKCGKRITKELLHNTDDRANLIAKMLEEEE